MSEQEAAQAISHIPVGSIVQIVKKDGTITELMLMSHKISSTEKKDYGNIQVPALPPAIIVRGGMRFGNFRLDVADLVNIAWIS